MKRPSTVQKRAAWLCLLIGPTMAIYFATLPSQMFNDAVAFGEEVKVHLGRADSSPFTSRYVTHIGPELATGLAAAIQADDPPEVTVTADKGADDGALVVTIRRQGDPTQHNIRLRQSLFQTQPQYAGYWTSSADAVGEAAGTNP